MVWEGWYGGDEGDFRTVDGCLAGQLLEHFGGSCESVAGLADGDVEDELFDAQLAHRVLVLFALFAVRLW